MEAPAGALSEMMSSGCLILHPSASLAQHNTLSKGFGMRSTGDDLKSPSQIRVASLDDENTLIVAEPARDQATEGLRRI